MVPGFLEERDWWFAVPPAMDRITSRGIGPFRRCLVFFGGTPFVVGFEAKPEGNQPLNCRLVVCGFCVVFFNGTPGREFSTELSHHHLAQVHQVLLTKLKFGVVAGFHSQFWCLAGRPFLPMAGRWVVHRALATAMCLGPKAP